MTESSFGGLPVYGAFYTVTTDGETSTALVVSVENAEAASVVVLTFTALGENAEPDPALIEMVDYTLSFFPPLLDE